MILIDSLIIGGIKFCLDKVATAVEKEMNDDSALREELMAAQMRLELGEITEEEFRDVEEELLSHIRVIRERQMATQENVEEGELRITGADVTFEADEMYQHSDDQAESKRR
jgi:hypothetical protein